MFCRVRSGPAPGSATSSKRVVTIRAMSRQQSLPTILRWSICIVQTKLQFAMQSRFLIAERNEEASEIMVNEENYIIKNCAIYS
jgi:hypothetical protein